MTKEELAAKLNEREIGREINETEADEAKAAGLLVLYGASDDLVELDGTIKDEVGAYGGATIRISPEGKLLADVESLYTHEWDDRDVLERYDVLDLVLKRAKAAPTIRALWCAEKDGPSWTFETELPHATFDVLEDDEVFCRGIVISMAEATSRAKVLAHVVGKRTEG